MLAPRFRGDRLSPPSPAALTLTAMSNTTRSRAAREHLEERARALRGEGLSMQEVSEQVGVPVPTLYQWAAAGKWRLADLAENAPPPDLPERGDGASETTPPEPVPADPMEAGQQALARSIAAMEAGRLVQADRAARLAERFFALAASGAGTPTTAGPAETPLDPGEKADRIIAEFRDYCDFFRELSEAQREAIHEGRLPASGLTFKEGRAARRNAFEAVAVGLIPGPEDEPTAWEALYPVATSMRDNLVRQVLLPPGWYQADEPEPPARWRELVDEHRALAADLYRRVCEQARREGREPPPPGGVVYGSFLADLGETEACEADGEPQERP